MVLMVVAAMVLMVTQTISEEPKENIIRYLNI